MRSGLIVEYVLLEAESKRVCFYHVPDISKLPIHFGKASFSSVVPKRKEGKKEGRMMEKRNERREGGRKEGREEIKEGGRKVGGRKENIQDGDGLVCVLSSLKGTHTFTHLCSLQGPCEFWDSNRNY